MSELTDLEVCKRIAEIENFGAEERFGRFGYPDGVGGFVVWNPLTDKALCFDLMVKHGIEITKMGDGYSASDDLYSWYERRIGFMKSDICPQKAICLAIIAKYDNA